MATSGLEDKPLAEGQTGPPEIVASWRTAERARELARMMADQAFASTVDVVGIVGGSGLGDKVTGNVPDEDHTEAALAFAIACQSGYDFQPTFVESDAGSSLEVALATRSWLDAFEGAHAKSIDSVTFITNRLQARRQRWLAHRIDPARQYRIHAMPYRGTPKERLIEAAGLVTNLGTLALVRSGRIEKMERRNDRFNEGIRRMKTGRLSKVPPFSWAVNYMKHDEAGTADTADTGP